MIYGLATAFAWGVADLLAAVTSRRVGSVGVAAVSQTAGTLALVMLFIAVRPAIHVSGSTALALVLSGAFAAGGYLLLYRALALGPVTLVSPIVAAYAAVTISLAVIILGESLAGFVLASVIMTIGGVVLASTDLRELRSGKPLLRDGVPAALGALVVFGVASFLLGRGSQQAGWLVATASTRVVTTVALLGVAVLRRRDLRGLAGRVILPVAALGIVDVLGISLYARGAELGLVSIVAAVASTFTLIPVAGGMLLFHERPAMSQGFGVAMVVSGLVLLGLGR